MRTIRSVWIVQHEDSPDNTILGVFATPAEAEEYASLVYTEYVGGVITTEFPIGYRHLDAEVRHSR